jgi:hypothetical protein
MVHESRRSFQAVRSQGIALDSKPRSCVQRGAAARAVALARSLIRSAAITASTTSPSSGAAWRNGLESKCPDHDFQVVTFGTGQRIGGHESLEVLARRRRWRTWVPP